MTNARTSTIKGYVITINENGVENKEFEVVTEYTHSAAKARKLAAKVLNVDENFIIVTEYINNKAEKINYNIEALLMDGYTAFYNEPESVDGFTTIKATVYRYSADVFGFENDEPFGRHYETVETTQSFTKVDARASVKMEFEGVYDNTHVIMVYNCTKQEFKAWFNVPNDELVKYELDR